MHLAINPEGFDSNAKEKNVALLQKMSQQVAKKKELVLRASAFFLPKAIFNLIKKGYWLRVTGIQNCKSTKSVNKSVHP